MEGHEEDVVLVDAEDNVLGTMPKNEVHGSVTPLHRGFSAFLFDQEGRLLIQQRSHHKKTWPLMWSNSVCGHPLLGECGEDAVARRAHFELGLEVFDVRFAAPYRYQATKDGVMEHEICPIYLGTVHDTPRPNPDEVEAIRWVAWEVFLEAMRVDPEKYSIWCREEADIIERERQLGTLRIF